MAKLADYPFEIRLLTLEEGARILISHPNFSGCISDGDTVDEALKCVADHASQSRECFAQYLGGQLHGPGAWPQ